MPWTTSTRNKQLPTDWAQRRHTILRRDNHSCRIRGPRCTHHATEVDHITPGHDHRVDNLRAVCSPCHASKSSAEGHAAQQRHKALRQRPLCQHPGRVP